MTEAAEIKMIKRCDNSMQDLTLDWTRVEGEHRAGRLASDDDPGTQIID